MEKIVVIGGTNGIGRSIVDTHLERGDSVVAVGRTLETLPKSERLTPVRADLSLNRDQEAVISILAQAAPQRLIFTAGVLTAKPGVTSEGKDAAFMLNHIARKRISEELAKVMPTDGRIGFLSSWGAYKKPPAQDYVFGQPGRNGLSHVMNGYVANDAWFAELAKGYPGFSVTGFYPGPTKGTKLLERGHTPFPFDIAKLLFPVIARPLQDVVQDFIGHIDKSAPGIRWFTGAKALDVPPHLSSSAQTAANTLKPA